MRQANLREYETYSHGPWFYNFEGLPSVTAFSLLLGEPNIDPDAQQNFSPSMRTMVDTAHKFEGATLDGYVHVDQDIMYEGFHVPAASISEEQVQEIKTSFHPDELQLEDGKYRFWWD